MIMLSVGSPSLKEVLKKASPDDRMIQIEGDIRVCEPLVIPDFTTITGTTGRIILSDEGTLILSGSDITLENLSIEGGQYAVCIDSHGKNISNIKIQNCRLDGFTIAGITVAASESHSRMSDILIEECQLNCGMVAGCDPVWGCAVAIGLYAAATDKEPGIQDAVLEDVTVRNCTIRGRSICSIISIVGVNKTPEDRSIFFTDCHVRRLHILNNDVADSTDTAICAEADYINHINCSMRDVEICGNRVEHGIFGISCTGGSPVSGNSFGASLVNTKVIGNETIGRDTVTEGNFGIVVMGGHLDGSLAENHDCFVVGIEIANNHVSHVGRGITVCGGHAAADINAPFGLVGNYVDKAFIHHNILEEVETCFILAGAWLEGRRLDWYSGYGRRYNTWGDEITDHYTQTVVAKNNYIRNIEVCHNHCKGYRFYLLAAGALGSGHGYMIGNRANDHIIFEKNTHELGENRQYVADGFFTDWSSGEENLVDMKLKYAISK